ncbi:hypothetical protein IF1G_02052 [Cordyceps javanica]|uniref:Uncharacterized protein n=1 Tax=Cordyceps javanica TaxID=43265 RepID=A0A545VDN2_9HYPO|nr:hypothetical protein IF1G_02052 [Cordyceps javanica]
MLEVDTEGLADPHRLIVHNFRGVLVQPSNMSCDNLQQPFCPPGSSRFRNVSLRTEGHPPGASWHSAQWQPLARFSNQLATLQAWMSADRLLNMSGYVSLSPKLAPWVVFLTYASKLLFFLFFAHAKMASEPLGSSAVLR